MKIIKIPKIVKSAQENQENKKENNPEKNYTIRSMLKDLSKWDQFLKMME